MATSSHHTRFRSPVASSRRGGAGDDAPLPIELEGGNQKMSPPAPGGTSEAGRPWASLPEDLIRLVASRLLAGDLLHYVRFRAVCTGWLSATASPRGRGVVDPRFHPRRWMMFPEGHGLHPGHPDLGGYARFVNLDTGALARAQLPLLGDHRAIDSVDGLLVLLRDHDSAVRLLHPFTGDVVEFPPLTTLLPQLATLQTGPLPSIEKLSRVVCASASFSAGAVSVMLALHQVFRVAFARTMDQQWTLSSWRYEICSSAPFSSLGKLYVAHAVIFSDDVEIFQIEPPVEDAVDLSCALQPPKLIATLPKGYLVSPFHMVECESEILVLGYKDYWKRSQIVVFKLADLVQKRCIQITSIGNNTLLLSERSLSVSPRALRTGLVDNVIITDSGRLNLVQYHLSSGTWSPAADECRMYGPAPGPCSFIHHMYNCCIRSRWNRGIIFGRNHHMVVSMQGEEQVST